jgi:hypothetical protein
VAVAYLLEASRLSEACRSDRAELDGPRVVMEVRDVTHAPGEAPDGFHVPVEVSGETHAAEEAPRAGPAEAAYCVACPGAIVGADCCAAGFQAAQLGADSASELPGACLADEQAAPAWSAEFPADEKVAAVSSGGFPDDGYSRAALGAVLADGCSPAVCLGTAEAAAQGPGLGDWQMVDVEPAAPDDRCPQEHCEFPAERAGYQECRAEEHCHSDDHRGCCCQGLPDEKRSGCCQAGRGDCPARCWAVRGEALRRDCLAHSVDPDDSPERSAVPDEALRRDFQGRSAVLDDSRERWVGRDEALHRDCLDHSAVLGDSRERSAVRDEALHHDCQERSVDPDDSRERWADPGEALRHDCQARSADPDDSPRHLADLADFQERSAAPGARQGLADSGHRGLHAARVEPEPAERREPF